MDLNIAQLRALFEPFDPLHLFRFWVVLALFIFLWGILIATCGLYATAKQFWKVHLSTLGVVLLLSGVAFLFFQVDPLFLLLGFSALAFVVQGDFAANMQKRSPNGRWLFLFDGREKKISKIFLNNLRRKGEKKQRRSA